MVTYCDAAESCRFDPACASYHGCAANHPQQHENQQVEARIAELERQRDAVLALCDRYGYYDGPTLVVDVDQVRAIYGGTALCCCSLVETTTVTDARPQYVRGKPNGCPIHISAAEYEAKRKAREPYVPEGETGQFIERGERG